MGPGVPTPTRCVPGQLTSLAGPLSAHREVGTDVHLSRSVCYWDTQSSTTCSPRLPKWNQPPWSGGRGGKAPGPNGASRPLSLTSSALAGLTHALGAEAAAMKLGKMRKGEQGAWVPGEGAGNPENRLPGGFSGRGQCDENTGPHADIL